MLVECLGKNRPKDDKYEKGVSCHYCYDKTSEERKERFLSRQKQIEIAKLRGTEHFGPQIKNNYLSYILLDAALMLCAQGWLYMPAVKNVNFVRCYLEINPSSMLEYSPKGTVPVLILQDGYVIDESLDVIDWALNLNDPDDWQTSKDTKNKRINQNK